MKVFLLGFLTSVWNSICYLNVKNVKCAHNNANTCTCYNFKSILGSILFFFSRETFSSNRSTIDNNIFSFMQTKTFLKFGLFCFSCKYLCFTLTSQNCVEVKLLRPMDLFARCDPLCFTKKEWKRMEKNDGVHWMLSQMLCFEILAIYHKILILNYPAFVLLRIVYSWRKF